MGKRLYRGLFAMAPIEAVRALYKRLFYKENYWWIGVFVIRLSHTATAPIACFLRNTFPKTAAGGCDSGCSSLHVGTHRLM
jgi:hypothetical protein